MIENMYDIMARINELKNRFGLNQKASSVPEKTVSNSFNKMTEEALKVKDVINTDLSGSKESANNINSLVDRYSAQNNISSALVKAVIKTESGYDPSVVSSKGAMGLMQLMPNTAKDYGVGNPFDAEQNIKGGVTMLKDLLDHYKGDYKQALAAYNAGKATVDKHGGVPPYKETGEYVKKVIDYYVRDSE